MAHLHKDTIFSCFINVYYNHRELSHFSKEKEVGDIQNFPYLS